MEIITGKKPVDPSFPDESQHVIQWVRDCLTSKKDPVGILDASLQGHPDTQIQEMLQAMGIALLCSSNRAEDRPTMKDVVALLREIRHDPSSANEAHKPTQGNGTKKELVMSTSINPTQLLLLQESSQGYSSLSVGSRFD